MSLLIQFYTKEHVNKRRSPLKLPPLHDSVNTSPDRGASVLDLLFCQAARHADL